MALNEGKHTGEFLLSEGNGSISREQILIDSTAGALVPGTVLGKLTAGDHVAYNNAGTDGEQVAVGILYAAVADAAVDQKAVMIARHAEVIEAELTGINADGKADLLARGIICR